MKTNALDKLVETISATSNGGFEGLVAYLCEKATGQSFRLSGSGQQDGQDARAESGVGNNVKIETKRYTAASLNRRELVAEIAQATLLDDVDLWVLVASCPVIDQTVKELEAHARHSGIEVVFIDMGVSGLQRLWVLMAAHSDAVEQWIKRHGICVDTASIRTALSAVRDHVDFEADRDALLAKLAATDLGFEDAKRRLNQSLIEVFNSPQQSNVMFQQNWAIDADTARTVPRLAVNQQLDDWWAAIATGTLPRAVALGEEGVGKTWSVIAWCKQLLRSDRTIVVPISCAIESIGPSDTLDSVLTHVLARRSGYRDANFWRRRLARWLTDTEKKTPFILIVLDGLNEKPEHHWRVFLSVLDSPLWQHGVAVLATDRPGHWAPRCEARGVQGFHEIPVSGYDDAELKCALQHSSRTLSDIPDAMLSLVRKPRYCELVLEHFDELVEESDFTVERLLYLDAQHRCANHPTFPLDGGEFISVIKQLAAQHRESKEFDPARIADNIPWMDNKRDVYEEIVSGGLMEANPEAPGTFRVERKRLVFGLGMLLAEVVRHEAKQIDSRAQIRETIERWFEPHPEMTLKVDIAGSAMFHSLLHDGFPALGRQEIIRYWLGLRNWGDQAQPAFADYVRRCPEDFLYVAEGFWSSEHDRGVAQDYFARSFLRHRDDPLVAPALKTAIMRWMGYIHANGPRISWADNETKRLERRQTIEQRAGQQLVPGVICVEGHDLTVVEDVALLRLSRFAILLMSGGDRMPFIECLVTWAIAGAIMGRASEASEVAWLLRLAEDDSSAMLLEHIRPLLESNSDILVAAGHTLLRCLGTADGKQLADEVPRDPTANEIELRKRHQTDPCTSWKAWNDDECRQCMDRDDIGVHWIVGRLGNRLMDPNYSVSAAFLKRVSDAIPKASAQPDHAYETDFDRAMEMATPALAGRKPGRLAEARRTAIRAQLGNRGGAKALSILQLNKYSPILDDTLVEQILAVMEYLGRHADTWTEETSSDEYHAEAHLFLGIIPHLGAERGLKILLKRPVAALDLLTLEHWFDKLPPKALLSVLANIRSEAEPRQLVRTLWFLSAHQYNLEPEDVDQLVALAKHPDWRVRGATLQFACRADDESLSSRILSDCGTFQKSKPLWEMREGAALIIRSTDILSIEEASKKLHPNALSYLVAHRGNTPSDVRFYCQLIDRTIAKISGSSDRERALPAIRVPGQSHPLSADYPDFDDRPADSIQFRDATTTWTTGRDEQNEHDNFAAMFSATSDDDRNELERQRVESIFSAWESEAYQWFGRRFSADALLAVCRQHGDIVSAWIKPALDRATPGRLYRSRLGSFLCFLCPGVLERDPDLGLELWRVLRDDSNTLNVFNAVSAAFQAPDNAQTYLARNELLSLAWNDAELAAIAYYAELFERSTWLDVALARMLASPMLHSIAKGLTLASFSRIKLDAFHELLDGVDVADSWVADSIPAIIENVRQNSNAMLWYRTFVSADDSDDAWGALEMTLLCADERFFLWRMEIEKIDCDQPKRRSRIIESRMDQINKKLDCGRARGKTLFGQKTAEKELIPFIEF